VPVTTPFFGRPPHLLQDSSLTPETFILAPPRDFPSFRPPKGRAFPDFFRLQMRTRKSSNMLFGFRAVPLFTDFSEQVSRLATSSMVDAPSGPLAAFLFWGLLLLCGRFRPFLFLYSLRKFLSFSLEPQSVFPLPRSQPSPLPLPRFGCVEDCDSFPPLRF